MLLFQKMQLFTMMKENLVESTPKFEDRILAYEEEEGKSNVFR